MAEVLIAVTVFAFVLTSAYAAIMSLAKGTESLVNYTEMNNLSRNALEIFARDARMTKEVYDWTDTKFTCKRKVWTGSSYVYRYITYEYVPNAGTFTRTVFTVDANDTPGTELESEILLYDVEDLNLVYYRMYDPEIQNYDPIARSELEVKHVQLEALLTRNVLTTENSNYIISARFMMRNKYVAE